MWTPRGPHSPDPRPVLLLTPTLSPSCGSRESGFPVYPLSSSRVGGVAATFLVCASVGTVLEWISSVPPGNVSLRMCGVLAEAEGLKGLGLGVDNEMVKAAPGFGCPR